MAKTILTADDSASMRQMVSMTLKHAGYDVIEAGDGREALDLLSKTTVDMVVADLHMPEIDGIELIKRLRSKPNYKYIPIIMLTTESMAQKKEAGRKAGATGWIVKPFRPEQLLSVVKRVLR